MTSFGFLLFAAVNLTAADAIVGLDRTHFNIGTYYVKPEFRTEETFRKMKDAGFDYVIDAFHPRDIQTHDLMKRTGIKAVLLRRCPHCWGGKVDEIGRLETIAPVSAYEAGVLSLKPEEGEAMMAIADEISADDFPHYGRVVARLREIRPGVVPYLNLHPALHRGENVRKYYRTANYIDYIAAYMKHVPLDYISYDLYPFEFRTRPDWGFARFYDNLRIVADACRDSGRSFWYIAQANTKDLRDDTTADKMRFSAYAAMAFGIEGLNWACWAKGWWERNIQNEDGTFGATYDRVKEVNAEIRRFDRPYMRFRRVNTHFTGFTGAAAKWLEPDPTTGMPQVNFNTSDSVSTAFFSDVRAEDGGPLLVGDFVSRDGADKDRAILVFAADDPLGLNPRDRTIRFKTVRNVRVVGPNGAVHPDRTKDGEYSIALRSSSCAFVVGR